MSGSSLIEAINFLEHRKESLIDAWGEAVSAAHERGVSSEDIRALNDSETREAYFAVVRDIALRRDLEQLAWDMANSEEPIPPWKPSDDLPVVNY